MNVLSVSKITRVSGTNGREVSKLLLCDFLLSLKILLTFSWSCIRCNLFMSAKITCGIISDTVILISMSFICLGISENDIRLFFSFHIYKNA